MQSVSEVFKGEYEIKKSNFLAYLIPFSEFEIYNKTLREENPKANHVVWAYRTLNEFGQIVENSSDDGEPKGTSGPPVLNVMRGADLIECAILIVRYFGGIKLGTGGLVRAYSQAANVVIDSSSLMLYESKEQVKFKTTYPFVQRMEYYFGKENIESKNREFEADGVVWSVDLTSKQKEELYAFTSTFEREGHISFY